MKIFIALFLLSFSVSANIVNDRLYHNVSLLSIVINSEKYENEFVSVKGFITGSDNGFKLCFSRSVCISNGIESLLLVKDSDDTQFSRLSGCYVSLSGRFVSDKSGVEIGKLQDIHDLFLAIGSRDYNLYNDCIFWNEIWENMEGNQLKIEQFYNRLLNN